MTETDLKKWKPVPVTELENVLNNKEYWKTRDAGYWTFRVDGGSMIEITDEMLNEMMLDVSEKEKK